MGFSQSGESDKRIRIDLPRGGCVFVTKAELSQTLYSMARQLGVQLQIDGAESVRTDASGAIQAKINPGGAAAGANPHNWYPVEVDSTHLTISISNAAGGVPTIGGVLLTHDPAPQLEVSATDLVYVYLKITQTLDINAHGVVLTNAVTTREITAETGVQTNTDTVRYYLLFTWKAGKVVNQTTFWHIGLMVDDDGTATSTPRIRDWDSAS